MKKMNPNYDEAGLNSYSEAPDPGEVTLNIEGLRQIGIGKFALSGVRPRPVDWDALRKALVLGQSASDGELSDKIGELVFKHDIMQILVERIK